ncbi:unnamed protein product [Calicophoron daubneyi]|uniref:P/Homo B domain-containing protein n=1 Tax=Calicophoron daubneyi TaxID=300641 RepID=A0AAV2TVC8_CALDB
MTPRGIAETLLFFLGTYLSLVQCRHQYVLECDWSKKEVEKFAIELGGKVLGEIDGTNAYVVSFDRLINEEDVPRVRAQRHADGIAHGSSEVKLTYQEPLRISKRLPVTLKEYQQKPPFDTQFAEMIINRARSVLPPPTPSEYDKQYQEYARKARECHPFDDPASKYAWQYLNDGKGASPFTGLDMNLYPAYISGLTGSGSKVAVVDDAFDTEHWDLQKNYDPSISVNRYDEEVTKSPRGTSDRMVEENGHGTRCAGLIAATANNSICSHGVAYEAKIGGIRIIGAVVTDGLEASGLSFKRNQIDIYCASWGPTDDGHTMDRPRAHTKRALIDGLKMGRGGLGSLFVFASGNGGLEGDNCGADGFVGSPEIIAVSALTRTGEKTVYSESCASVRMSIPIGGPKDLKADIEDLLPTSAENNQCVPAFIGTSAAAPMAAGCLALVLQSNRNLTTRDVEHLIPWSTRIPTPVGGSWLVNAAGILHSTTAGHGLLDCYQMTQLAKSWTSVGTLCKSGRTSGIYQEGDWAKLQAKAPIDLDYEDIDSESSAYSFLRKIVDDPFKIGLIDVNKTLSVSIDVNPDDETSGVFAHREPSCKVEVVEGIVVRLQWKHICRGSLSVRLTSPSNATVMLLDHRRKDQFAGEGDMNITSVAHWGENITGKWTVEVRSDGVCENPIINKLKTNIRGGLFFVGLEFRGTSKEGSGYSRNLNILKDLLTDVGLDAINKRAGRFLNGSEIASIFEFQRQRALRNDLELVNKKCA